MIPDVLRRAADVIDTSGWNRNSDINASHGGVCANGAIRLAVGHRAYVDPFGRHRLDVPTDMPTEVARGLGRQIAATHMILTEYMHSVHKYDEQTFLPSIIRYNDSIALSGGEVSALFRAAAMWVESAPERELRAVERSARKDYLFPKTAPAATADANDVVLAAAGV